LVLSLLLVAGCALLPWAGKKEGSAPEGDGKGEARLISEESVLPIVVQGDVWLVPQAGGDAIRVTNSGRASDPAMSLDGHALAYVLTADQGEDVAQAELLVMVLDTGDTFVAANGTPPWGPPSWSPDGAYLAWPLSDALHVYEVPSGVEAATYATALPGAALPAPVWSADSAMLYYPLLVDGQPVLHSLPIGGEPAALSALDPDAANVMAASVDGRLALWQPGELAIIGAETAEAETTPVALPAAMAPAKALAWSAEGDSLALVDEAGGLWVGTAEGFGEEPDYQSAGLSGVRWLSAEALALWQSDSSGVETLLRADVPGFATTALGTLPESALGALAVGDGGAVLPSVVPVGFWYTVRPGDTLWDISLSYGTTVADLVAANSIANANLIYVGQQLWIPVEVTPTPPATTVPDETLTPGITATATLAVTLTPSPWPTQTMTPTATLVPTETLTPSVTPTQGPGVWHTVTWGDTLSGIASRYGVTVEAIMQANALTNPNLIRLGQRLWIPLSDAPATPTPTVVPTLGPTFEYVVQQGDSLTIIATRFGTTWQVLAQINGLNLSSILYPGQKLLVPGSITPTPVPTATPSGPEVVYYVVQPGDTLSTIASRFGITWQELAAANALNASSVIYPGQRLRIP
jgi:LysM repeat protein